jgi:hypothetical protein
MKLQVVNPVAEKVEERASLAPRLASLEGKFIGLYWNYKAGGDAALKRAAELLQARFPGLGAKIYTGSLGGSNHLVTTDDAKRIAGECAGMIGSTAD